MYRNSTAYRYNGAVNGQLILDVDDDNAFAGVDVVLTVIVNGASITRTATTDADGKFNFDKLAMMSWSLDVPSVQTVADWSSYVIGFVKDNNGNTSTGAGILPLSGIVIDSTNATISVEIGYKGSAKISGYIVIDTDPADGGNAVNGVDTPVASAIVTLSSDLAGFVSRTTTNASGYYEWWFILIK